MEAISTMAKEAAANEQSRRHSEDDLATLVGPSIGNEYIANPGDSPVGVLVVITGATHCLVDKLDTTDIWRQPAGIDDEQFKSGAQVEVEWYEFDAFVNGGVHFEDEPAGRGQFTRAALRAKFGSRRPAEPVQTGHDGDDAYSAE